MIVTDISSKKIGRKSLSDTLNFKMLVELNLNPNVDGYKLLFRQPTSLIDH